VAAAVPHHKRRWPLPKRDQYRTPTATPLSPTLRLATGDDQLNFNNYSDLWHSSDVQHWIQATASAPFSPRSSPAVAAANGRVWVIGCSDNTFTALNDVWSSADGITGYTALADVWSSSDGIAWSRATAATPSPGRSQHQGFALNNQFCIVAGLDSSGRKNDLWCSADGASWRQAYAATVQFP
jgi:hypothetical protein